MAILKDLIVQGASKFIGKINGLITKSETVVDYGDTTQTIDIGYGGAGATSCDILACYTTPKAGSTAKIAIKDIKTSKVTVGAATNDGSGNNIANTYLKRTGGTVTGTITQTNNDMSAFLYTDAVISNKSIHGGTIAINPGATNSSGTSSGYIYPGITFYSVPFGPSMNEPANTWAIISSREKGSLVTDGCELHGSKYAYTDQGTSYLLSPTDGISIVIGHGNVTLPKIDTSAGNVTQYRTGRTIRIIPTTNTGTITVTYNTSSGNKTLAVRNADGAAKTFICDPYGYWWPC